MEWPTRPAPEDKVSNIDWLISLFTGNKKYDGKPDPSIKSWAQPVRALQDIMKKRCSLKGALVFCPYLSPNGLKEFSSGRKNKQCKDYLGIIHNTYHGGNI